MNHTLHLQYIKPTSEITISYWQTLMSSSGCTWILHPSFY